MMIMHPTLAECERLVAEAETDDFKALLEIAGLDPARDLRFADWSDIDFSSADLSGCDFTGARLVGCRFDGAAIAGARFDQAMVDRASLRRAADWDAHVATWSAPGEASSTLPEKAITWHDEPLTWNNEPITWGDEVVTSSNISPLRLPYMKPASHRHLPNFAVFSDAPFAPEMVVLPAGSFLMGSPENEPGRRDNAGPQRQVTVAGFAIGRYPVTFDEYDHCCAEMNWEKPDDRGWGRGKRPVVNVAWFDARAYVSWLSQKTGRDYRLASEAEWEYACRAGTTTAYWWGDDFDASKANTRHGGPGRTTEVGSYPANPWGLFDTLGNVWEWLEDHWHGTYEGAPNDGRAWVDPAAEDSRPRVLRGGSWLDDRGSARCADRVGYGPLIRYSFIGFRVVCSSPS